jgi:hypothetical protein
MQHVGRQCAKPTQGAHIVQISDKWNDAGFA